MQFRSMEEALHRAAWQRGRRWAARVAGSARVAPISGRRACAIAGRGARRFLRHVTPAGLSRGPKSDELASPLLHSAHPAIIAQSNALRLPAIYQWPETAHLGGLLAYGPRFSEPMAQWARQFAKVLRGAKPADLPVQQPTKFELVINQKTAKLLGLEFAPTLLARADEVIE
ncbi:MAG: ABC transporter substrate binding protein [Xanthobacteraceae bacterium]